MIKTLIKCDSCGAEMESIFRFQIEKCSSDGLMQKLNEEEDAELSKAYDEEIFMYELCLPCLIKEARLLKRQFVEQQNAIEQEIEEIKEEPKVVVEAQKDLVEKSVKKEIQRTKNNDLERLHRMVFKLRLEGKTYKDICKLSQIRECGLNAKSLNTCHIQYLKNHPDLAKKWSDKYE